MSGSTHLAIREALAEALRRDPPVCDRIDEQRDLTLPSGVTASISVFRDTSRAAPGAILGAPFDWTTRMRVLVKARATSTGTAEANADALALVAYARVMADPSLGGVADDLVPEDLTWDQDDADTGVALALLNFRITHRTAGGSIA